MRRWAWLLLATVACSDDDACPLTAYKSGFELVLESATWSDADYSVDITYTDSVELTFHCEIHAPSFVENDAGLALRPDSGIDAQESFPCTATKPTGYRARGVLGQAMVLSLEGTPTKAHVVVRENGTMVQDVMPTIAYQTAHPDGPHCNGLSQGAARIELN